MFAAARNLDNLCVIVDDNGVQADGRVEDICPLQPLDKKMQAFNLNTIIVDGHDYKDILSALENAKTTKGKPTVIIAKTVKGKGVSFMENKSLWHGKAPNDSEYAVAMDELKGGAQ
jgi:transketolase